MKPFEIRTHSKTILADTLTPVNVYLKIRDKFSNPLLLESTDFNGDENSYSIVCFEPIARISVHNSVLYKQYPDKSFEELNIPASKEFVPQHMHEFFSSFTIRKANIPLRVEGFFGYNSYDAVKYFETIQLHTPTKPENNIPEIVFNFYRYIIAFNHFKSEMHIIENIYNNESSTIDEIESIILNKNFCTYSFKTVGTESSNFTDEEFIDVIAHGKKHCFRGDVIQIVLSRQFSQSFVGDEFNVYRTLRSINPSPYLFFFDFGTYKIFGSSPESQIVIRDNKATINPIAGTFRRTGDDIKDAELAKQLAADPKENSEHIMLVDLARNDLSRNGHTVTVEKYREIQYFSHVLHMVSKVSAQLQEHTNPVQLIADTFPAGTLSGAPKYRAMELIDTYENQGRGFYGGSLGYIDIHGNVNQAIMIRSFLSKDNTLYYQAGAGVVAKSIEENELQEINNKLAALKSAIHNAEQL
ncbi:MAG TPA: anthranilate synthase component I family protein [Bacteroidales bacterium]|nr:anthranilate synthase component I family protein [Bacteroidales bacterium]